MYSSTALAPVRFKLTFLAIIPPYLFFISRVEVNDTHIHSRTNVKSLNDPLHRKLRQLCCLRCRFDCYRVERTSSRAGVSPAEVQRLSRRTVTPTTAWKNPQRTYSVAPGPGPCKNPINKSKKEAIDAQL